MPKPRTRAHVAPSQRRRWSAEDARAVLTALSASSLSPRAFAAREKIDVQRLHRWRRRLAADGAVPAVGSVVEPVPSFVEVVARPAGTVEVVLRGGRLLRLGGDRAAGTRTHRCGARGAAGVLSLPPSVRLFVATQLVDGRKGADSLMVLVRDVFRLEPLSGHLYVFFTRRRDRVRMVYWDRDGFAMWTKRLQSGRYHPPRSGDGRLAVQTIEAAELALIVAGIELAGARRRTRWQPGTAARESGTTTHFS